MAGRGDEFIGVPLDEGESFAFAFRISFPPQANGFNGDGIGDVILILPNLSHLEIRGDDLVAYEHVVEIKDGLSNTIAFGEWRVETGFTEWGLAS